MSNGDDEDDLYRAREYPIETDGLDKGSVIDADTIKQSCGHRRGSDGYRLAMLRIQEYVERRLAERGLVVVTRIEKYTIPICTDTEASDYTQREIARGLRKMRRHHRKMGTVDRANLTDKKRMEHDIAHTIIGRSLSAYLRESRKPAAIPCARSTPVFLPGADDADAGDGEIKADDAGAGDEIKAKK